MNTKIYALVPCGPAYCNHIFIIGSVSAILSSNLRNTFNSNEWKIYVHVCRFYWCMWYNINKLELNYGFFSLGCHIWFPRGRVSEPMDRNRLPDLHIQTEYITNRNTGMLPAPGRSQWDVIKRDYVVDYVIITGINHTAAATETASSARTYRVRPGTTGYVLKLQGTSWNYMICPEHTVYVLELQGTSWSYRVRPETTEYVLKLQGTSWNYRVRPETTWYVLKLQGMSWNYRVCPETTGYVLKLQGMSWNCRVRPGTTGYVLRLPRTNNPQQSPNALLDLSML